MKIDLFSVEEFDWDQFNIEKNRKKHEVEPYECEEVFFNEPYVATDEKHSCNEERYYSLGKTYSERLLFVVFTVRDNKIRVISARDMTIKERRLYYEAIKRNT